MANTAASGDAREARDGMPAEVDFSESLPNPYVGKARRRVPATADDCDPVETVPEQHLHRL